MKLEFKDLKPKQLYYKITCRVVYNNDEWNKYSYFDDLKTAKLVYNSFKEECINKNITEVDLCKIKVDDHKRIYSWQHITRTKGASKDGTKQDL